MTRLPLASVLASERETVELPTIALLKSLGWEHMDLAGEQPGPANPTGRLSFRDAVLPAFLRAALARLNPGLPTQALADAEAALVQDRSALLPVAAQREVWRLLRDGVAVRVRRADGETEAARVRLVDWREPAANHFLLASQAWFQGTLYTRRPDLVGFVNGIPLLLVECKAPHKPVAEAYDDNLRDYRDTIPHLFPYLGAAVLTNGIKALIGAPHAPFDEFSAWKRLAEDGPESEAPETLLRGTCAAPRLLHLVENLTVFEETRDGLVRKIARYHQALAVERVLGAVHGIEAREGRLGVVWHTQGSGKSLSMVFLTETVLRTLGNNWTFVIVTDRDELDDQLAGTYAATGALTKTVKEAQAQSRVHLRELLAGQERYVFTLIHKFGTERGEGMEVLSERRDIIVITDEAHRSQYDQLAANMRRALPNAAFLGFTGTPLIAATSERTREVFGDYVSIYDFAQSIADGATVPLYYDERKPELHLARDDLREELDALLEDAGLDEATEARLQADFGRQYHLITRDDRLDKVAADLVRHFAARGYRGKAMFVAIDKATAVRMYDKVRVAWAALLAEEEARLGEAPAEARDGLVEKLDWMRTLDMAVVVSQGQGEVEELRARGVDILPHRARMQRERLDERFKKASDPLRLVFVCAMWITGFDVPTCSTMYLDKPMRNHTLMQAIARANRRAPEKAAGTIVDYVGVFANLQRALAIYTTGQSREPPVRDVSALAEAVEEALEAAYAACEEAGADLGAIIAVPAAQRAARIGAAVEVLIAPDERKRGFLRLADAAVRAYKALLPDERAAGFLRQVAALVIVAEALRTPPDRMALAALSARIEALLDAAVAGVSITAPVRVGAPGDGLLDLSSIDFDKLGAAFAGQPRAEAQALRDATERRVRDMAAANPTRLHLVEKLEEMIAAYNAGTLDAARLLEQLKLFCAGLDGEGRRASREELTEEELAIFDLLTRPEPKLTRAQQIEVKGVARELLGKLRELVAVREWRTRQQARAAVQSNIRFALNALPEDAYPEPVWNEKVEAVWEFVLGRADGAGSSGQVPGRLC